jgi:hypothetical protein
VAHPNQGLAILMFMLFTLATVVVVAVSKAAMARSRSSFAPWSVWRLYRRTFVALAVIWVLAAVVLAVPGMSRWIAVGLVVVAFLVFFSGLLLDLEAYRSGRQPSS